MCCCWRRPENKKNEQTTTKKDPKANVHIDLKIKQIAEFVKHECAPCKIKAEITLTKQ